MEKVKIGVIGMGNRGSALLQDVFSEHPDVEVAAVCDVYEDRCKRAAEILRKKGRSIPYSTENYRQILEDPEIDAVVLCTSWEHHIDLCIEAMEAG